MNKSKIIKLAILGLGLTVNSSWGAYQLPQGSLESQLGEGVKLLKEIETGFSTISAKVKKSVLYIKTKKQITTQRELTHPFERFFFGHNGQFDNRQRQRKRAVEGVGSGFIIDNEKGYILTNRHVVRNADEIKVTSYNGVTMTAKVVGLDEQTDIAILKVEHLSEDLGQIYLSNSSKIKIGNWAIAVGAPHGLAQTITRGTVSARGRGNLSITGQGDFIQTDAAINPGNSGGPLIDINGDAIGMNTAIFSRSGGSQGIGFAIPSNILKEVSQRLIEDGKIDRAYLGVHIQNLTKDLANQFRTNLKEGVIVTKVQKNSPAYEAGLKEGDIIYKVRKSRVKDSNELSYLISMSPINKKTTIKIFRNGEFKKINVLLEKRDQKQKVSKYQSNPSSREFWGMDLKKSPNGLSIAGFQKNSPALKSDLRINDIIIGVNNKSISKLSDLKKVGKGKKILLRILRNNYYFFTQLKRI